MKQLFSTLIIAALLAACGKDTTGPSCSASHPTQRDSLAYWTGTNVTTVSATMCAPDIMEVEVLHPSLCGPDFRLVWDGRYFNSLPRRVGVRVVDDAPTVCGPPVTSVLHFSLIPLRDPSYDTLIVDLDDTASIRYAY